MKGLEEYINKHGRHFTVELAYRATDKYWDALKIYNILQKKVYYNVAGYTLGGIVYLFNGISDYYGGMSDICFRRNFVLLTLRDVNTRNVFNDWKDFGAEQDFDFTPYI
jgi:hypothetical protein